MGNTLLPPEELRRKFDLYLTPAERESLESKARDARLPMSIFLRRLALGAEIQPPPSELAREQYASLARVGANLNQLAAAVNAGKATGVDPQAILAVGVELQRVRLMLLGGAGAEPTARNRSRCQ
jgi:hypothetical protein